MPDDSPPSFSGQFNSRFSFGTDGQLAGSFGTAVLEDLIAGIDEFRAAATAQISHRMLGPGMLGAFAWLDDQQLLNGIGKYPHAYITFTKQLRPFPPAKRARLQTVLDRCPGFPADALPEFDGLVLCDQDGQPHTVGPSTPRPHLQVPALRTVGYRRTGNRLVPLLHAKMVLLGDLCWHDEDDFGPADILSFRPQRLWIGSANGTYSSRFSLEFGCWQTEPELLKQAEQFLIKVVAHSERIDPDADDMEPDLAQPVYDVVAMAEAAGLLDDGDEPDHPW
jgi:hypothetical protein